MKRNTFFATLCMLCMFTACSELDGLVNNGNGDNTEQPGDNEKPNDNENPGGETMEDIIAAYFGNVIEPYEKGVAQLYNMLRSDEYNYSTVNQPIDSGTTQLTRALFACQEITTDECFCAWSNDRYVAPMQTNNYGSETLDPVFGVFFRTMQIITYSNEFLRQTEEDKLDSRGANDTVKARVAELRAEARMIRALCYWMAMDTFGDFPIVTEMVNPSLELPAKAPRSKVFAYIIDQLEQLCDDPAFAAAQSNYPRMDKGSALALLSRLYLNAEVYTGMPEWERCKVTCEEIFTLGYRLAPTYAELFRGDNGENPDARNEFLIAIPYESTTTSYGGTSFIINSSLSGIDGGWGGLHLSGAFVNRFFDISNADFATGAYDCTDERGKLFDMAGSPYNGEFMDVDNVYNFNYGWRYYKYNNIPHDMTADTYVPAGSFSDVDLPIIRLGEIYLTYAEACVRLGDGMRAQPKMDELAVRTGTKAIALPAMWDASARDMFVAERARELMWEMCRRTDLIRYDLFSGGDYLWPLKGGETIEGQPFSEDMEFFPLLDSYITDNPNLLSLDAYYLALLKM